MDALVVEGGAMRGVFSAGVLDTFIERNFYPFDFVLGCSAGACNAANYLARQRERGWRCYSDYMQRIRTIDVGRYIRGGHLIDLDDLWRWLSEKDPLDVLSVCEAKTRLLIAVTGVETGKPEWLEPSKHDLLQALLASCAVPLLYRGFASIDSKKYVDGGVCAAIPVEEAYRLGARRIMVVRSRPAGYTREPRFETWAGAFATRKQKYLSEAIRLSNLAYNLSVAFIQSPPSDCKIVEVAPTLPLSSRRLTKNISALEVDYSSGLIAGGEAIGSWNEAAAFLPC
jgi:predicted patatin/cPLA2 family phospholipase